MAIFFSTVCKKIRKSYGTVTTCRLNGQNILRDKVTEVYNPKTLPQQMQRRRYATLVELAGVFCQATPLGYPQRPKNQNPDNQFIQLNHGAVDVNEALEVTVDYQQIVLAKGNRILPKVGAVLSDDKTQLSFTWEHENYIRHSAEDDQLYAVLFEQNLKQAKVFLLGKRSDTEAADMALPDGWDSAQLLVYVFMLSKNRKNASVSRCLQLQ